MVEACKPELEGLETSQLQLLCHLSNIPKDTSTCYWLYEVESRG